MTELIADAFEGVERGRRFWQPAFVHRVNRLSLVMTGNLGTRIHFTGKHVL